MEDGWLTVRFLIVAGNEAISYRPEFWNGARDGSDAGAGTVYFDSYSVSTTKSVRDLQEEIKADYNLEVDGTKFTRVPTTVKYTNEDGEEATKYITYSEKEVLWIYDECKTQIIDLTTVYTVNEEDRTTSDDDTDVEDSTSSDSQAPETSFSAALQITSIIVASVLIAALIAVLVRMLVKKYRKDKGASASYYNRDSREKAGLAIEAKKARLAAKESDTVEVPEEEATPYDYDNMENNLVEESEEENAEESQDEESSPATEEENAETIEEAPAESEDNGENN